MTVDGGVSELEPLNDRDCGFDAVCPYFPSQRVTAPPAVWRAASWIGQAPRNIMRRRSATIERLTLTEFGVHWLATAQVPVWYRNHPYLSGTDGYSQRTTVPKPYMPL